MNPKTIITELRRINAWRRGDETVGQPAPGHFGDVLDAAAESLRSLIASNTTLRSEARAELKQRKADVTRMEEYLRNSGRNMDEAQEQIAELSADLDRVTAERDKSLRREDEMRVKLLKEIEGSCALRARVAELEKEAMILSGTVEAVTTQRQQAEQRKAELEASCRDLRVAYEQNASQCVQLNRELAMKPDTVEWLNGATIQRQRAEQAEARVAELAAALREIDEIVNDANHSAEDRLCAAANRLLNTRAESATPAKQEGAR